MDRQVSILRGVNRTLNHFYELYHSHAERKLMTKISLGKKFPQLRDSRFDINPLYAVIENTHKKRVGHTLDLADGGGDIFCLHHALAVRETG